MPQPICFSDGTYYDCSKYPLISDALLNHPDLCTVNARTFQFKVVGVLCLSDIPIIVFPKNYKDILTGETFIAESKILIKTLLRYRNEASLEAEEKKYLFGDSQLNGNRIASALFLLEDYCQNGYITRQSEISTIKQNGRIDWVATVNKQTPVFSNRRPVYTNPIVRKRRIDNNNIVHLAHRYVISECFKEWGWLFDYDSNINLNSSLPLPINETVDALRTELQKTFLSREVNVIRELIRYLTETSGSDNNKKLDIIATPYFSFVWEAICGFLFDNQYPRLKSLLPQPEWESDIVSGSIAQRPDIFFVDDALYILDAKYYNYNHNIPGWHDVVKQMFYRHTMVSIRDSREYLRMLPSQKEIYNAFLFPGNINDLLYVGKVTVPQVESMGEVIAVAINQDKALSAYSKRESGGFCTALQSAIKNCF
ncbi:MAG: LlaJI family restriction endonuclease [Prevotellaceae bacterium]|nr:LlaJI family restriction endonuclease [Prevotellaceae bacterium]